MWNNVTKFLTKLGVITSRATSTFHLPSKFRTAMGLEPLTLETIDMSSPFDLTKINCLHVKKFPMVRPQTELSNWLR